MKKYILSLMLLFVMAISHSQNYFPLLQNSAWCTEDYVGTGSIMGAYTKKSDTTIGNITYSRLYKGNTAFLVREDTTLQKVWAILPNTPVETLMYDFAVAPGTLLNLNYFGTNPCPYTVTSIDSINTPQGLRKRIKLVTTNPTFNPNLYWIEGIGSSNSPVYLNEPTYAPGTMSVGHCVICAYTSAHVQTYTGACMIPCLGYLGSPCYSFITGINETRIDIAEITLNRISDDLVSIRSVNEKITAYKVFSMEGRLLRCNQSLNKNYVLISTTDWKNGLYIVEVTLENDKRVTRKFCK